MSEHKTEDMKGRMKEAVGTVTGDKGLQREGKMDQASAATKKTIDGAADAVKDAISPKK
ncbi:MAG: CsbD family protein [Coriobacteriia bacterium]|nr:CsbD family protein [Coriobacteriia bacterium]